VGLLHRRRNQLSAVLCAVVLVRWCCLIPFRFSGPLPIVLWYSDITVIVDGNSIAAHKLVLASRGTWSSDDLDQVSQIELQGMRYKTTYNMLNWVWVFRSPTTPHPDPLAPTHLLARTLWVCLVPCREPSQALSLLGGRGARLRFGIVLPVAAR
jgi:hypothetical protein